MDAGTWRPFAWAEGGGLAGEGAELSAVDRGVQEDDVLGVER